MSEQTPECDVELLEATTTLAARCRSQDWHVAVAESCTGGWLSRCCTDLPGSSGWFECGWVTYSNTAKVRLLGVDAALIEQHGAVSQPVVDAMVRGVMARASCDLACAISGVAGPEGGTPEAPVGRVHFAFAEQGKVCCEVRDFPLDREAVRRAAVLHALWCMGGPHP